MDAILGTTLTVQPEFLNRALVMSSTPRCIPVRTRCGGESRDFVNGRRESLKRSEVLELLSTALDALLLPDNQKLLKERLVRNSERSRMVSVEVSFPLQVVEPSPSEASKEISAPPQVGRGLEASVEESSLSPSFVQQIPSSATLKESEPLEDAESVHQGVRSLSSTSEMRVSSETTSLSTMRRLKNFNVHDYVHSALRKSLARSHLRSRKIEE